MTRRRHQVTGTCFVRAPPLPPSLMWLFCCPLPPPPPPPPPPPCCALFLADSCSKLLKKLDKWTSGVAGREYFTSLVQTQSWINGDRAHGVSRV